MIVFDKQTLIELLQTDGYYGSTVRFKKVNRKWRDNHERLIHHYEAMKESRKRIIKERDKLRKEKEILEKYRDKHIHYINKQFEIDSLYRSLQNCQNEIDHLKTDNRNLARDNMRLYELLKKKEMDSNESES